MIFRDSSTSKEFIKICQIRNMLKDEDEYFQKLDSSKRRLSFRKLGLVIALCFLGYYLISSKLGNGSTTEVEEEVSDAMSKRVQELEKARQEEEDFQRSFQQSLNPNDTTEIFMGSYRYKLFKKPTLPFQQANKFCRKMDGRLPLIHKVENSRKLQQLIGDRDRKKEMEEYYGRSKNGVWVGREKVKKKKKKKNEEGEDDRMRHIDPGMMGGGGRGEEMCPAISPNSLHVPAPCHSPLPFICEFDKNAIRKPIPKPEEYGGRRGMGRYGSDMDYMHDEM